MELRGVRTIELWRPSTLPGPDHRADRGLIKVSASETPLQTPSPEWSNATDSHPRPGGASNAAIDARSTPIVDCPELVYFYLADRLLKCDMTSR
jgi:hypothetical protein